MPRLLYGTAWKKARTADLVYEALKTGFRGIDTACQPKHYEEKLVGDGIRKAISEGVVTREDLFIQTKFTSPAGQDPRRTPYEFSLRTTDQVQASVTASLQNLSTGSDNHTYLDSVLLHSPLPSLSETIVAWRTLSTYVISGQIRQLGISNCPAKVLQALLSSDEVKIKPSIVQNRFYPDSKYDFEVRDICRKNGIVWQSFWTLTGNPGLMQRSVAVERLADQMGVEKATAMYSLVLGLNEGLMSILCGTTDLKHMKDDLDGDETIRKWATEAGAQDWKQLLRQFRTEIGDWHH